MKIERSTIDYVMYHTKHDSHQIESVQKALSQEKLSNDEKKAMFRLVLENVVCSFFGGCEALNIDDAQFYVYSNVFEVTEIRCHYMSRVSVFPVDQSDLLKKASMKEVVEVLCDILHRSAEKSGKYYTIK